MASVRPTTRLASPVLERSAPAGVRSAESFDHLYVTRPRRWLLLILLAYLSAALLYAVVTPAWQNPDEPAHYNYISHIAESGSLPVLHEGDFDLGLIQLLQRSGAGYAVSVDALQYESYQPPLYYLTATPVFLLMDGSLAALRLFSVALGLASLILLYACLELVFPNKPLIPLGATAFAGLLPMHVSVLSSVTNDVMAELLTMAAAYVLLRWMRPYFYAPAVAAGRAPHQTLHDRRHLFVLGMLLGLGMITKIYAYALLPMFAALVLWTIWRTPRSWRALGRGLRRLAWLIVPALAIAAPMWARNLSLYGGWDLLGLQWHDRVVQGQLTTSDYISQNGTLDYFEQILGLTFRSFWGVFGWMTMAMDARIYQAALYFSGVLFLGLLWASVRLISGPPDTDMDSFQTSVIAVLGLLIVVVAASFVWYNLKFVQHQGRYFFWGMLAIGTVVALGWREVLHPLQGTITGLIAAVLTVSLLIGRLIGGDADKWTLLMAGTLAAFLLVQPFLLLGTGWPHPWLRVQRIGSRFQTGPVARALTVLRFVAWSAPFLLLYALNLVAPFLFILP